MRSMCSWQLILVADGVIVRTAQLYSKPYGARFTSGLGQLFSLRSLSATIRPATDSCKINLAKNRSLSIFAGQEPMSAFKGSQTGIIIIIIYIHTYIQYIQLFLYTGMYIRERFMHVIIRNYLYIIYIYHNSTHLNHNSKHAFSHINNPHALCMRHQTQLL